MVPTSAALLQSAERLAREHSHLVCTVTETHTTLQQEARKSAHLQVALTQLKAGGDTQRQHLLALAARFDAQKLERAKIESLTAELGRK